MKRNKFIALALGSFLSVFLIGKADAAVLTHQFLVSEIKKDITKQLKSEIPGRINIDIKNLPYNSINISDGNVLIVTTIDLKHFSPVTIAKVNVFVNDKNVMNFGVPIKISVYDKVWVAVDTINKGGALTSYNLALEEKEIGFLAKDAAREDFYTNGKLVEKVFRAGDIIDTRYIKTMPIIIRNTPVSVIFKSTSFTVTLPAEALEDGNLGDYVRVRNDKLKRSYVGKVISANTVLVNI